MIQLFNFIFFYSTFGNVLVTKFSTSYRRWRWNFCRRLLGRWWRCRWNRSRTLIGIEAIGIGPFGITNSLAPPALRPNPTKPRLSRKIGEASPLLGVGNSITVKVLLNGIVNLFADWLAFIPAVSSGSHNRMQTGCGSPSGTKRNKGIYQIWIQYRGVDSKQSQQIKR